MSFWDLLTKSLAEKGTDRIGLLELLFRAAADSLKAQPRGRQRRRRKGLPGGAFHRPGPALRGHMVRAYGYRPESRFRTRSFRSRGY